MPPSGFNTKGINGLLTYVMVKYEKLLTQKDLSALDETTFLEKTVSALEQEISTSFPEDETKGLKIFMVECYKDLVKEIYAGKDKYHRPVYAGQALEKEISQLKQHLTDFKI
jgi:hypothetical protein